MGDCIRKVLVTEMPSLWELETAERLARIEEKLDQTLNHDDRLGSLERWRSWINGATAVIILVVGWVVKHIVIR